MGNSENLRKLIDKFYSDYKNSKLGTVHILVLTIHVCICVFFWQAYKADFTIRGRGVLKGEMMLYFFIVPFALLLSYYRQLRNYKVYLSWLIVGIVQFIFYSINKSNPELSIIYGTRLSPFKALLLMLLSFQLLRQFYIFSSLKELIITFGKKSWFDEEDNRKILWQDVLFSLIIYVVINLSFLI